jgi:5-methylcytosine-specific restriction protein A
MPRAHRICNTDGCLKAAVKDGYCDTHKRKPWAGSIRNLQRPSNWRQLRSDALKRDRFSCVICFSPATDVDHIRPVALGGSWSLENLQSLCTFHHDEKTKQEALERRKRS